jgi:pyruvate kinase
MFGTIVDYIDESIRQLKEMNLVSDDDVVIHVGSTPTNERGRTNFLKLSYV